MQMCSADCSPCCLVLCQRFPPGHSCLPAFILFLAPAPCRASGETLLFTTISFRLLAVFLLLSHTASSVALEAFPAVRSDGASHSDAQPPLGWTFLSALLWLPSPSMVVGFLHTNCLLICSPSPPFLLGEGISASADNFALLAILSSAPRPVPGT